MVGVETSALVLGSVLMAAGIALVLIGVFREVGGFDAPTWHVLALPLLGFSLILLGQWMVQ